MTDTLPRLSGRLKPRDLQMFLAVAEQRNIAKAAGLLATSRPVVSKVIAGLERTLGVPLFERSPQGVVLTAYGELLRKRSIVLLDDLSEAMKEIEFFARGSAGELRIGCSEPMAAGFVPAVIERLSFRYPQLRFQLQVGDAVTLQVGALRERKVDLVIARVLGTDFDRDIESKALFCEKMVVAVGLKSAWAKRRKIMLEELLGAPWILAPLELELGSPIVQLFRSHKLAALVPTVLGYSLPLRYSLLDSGRFVTALPASVLRYGAQSRFLKVLPIELPAWNLPISVITLKNRALNPIAALFIECTRELARPLAQDG
jgi:DNA-binding transcriptional LysR family regulator